MKLKVKTPFSYILWIILFFIIALFVSLLTGIVEITDVFVYLMSAIVGWIVLIILALIGAIFIGMLLSHRILTVGAFTPFEEEMLKMRGDIKKINDKMDILMKQEKKGDEED
ncbi:MAG: hypothetical protein JSV56_00415 [Methanomassiliicoccales archaeon]|nr:MAG: hypothetical protein JSV56_00415 [Methanomassiliicoccales archaeon]